MQPISFLTFIWRCIDRAAADSANFFGWNVRSILTTAVLVGLGFFIHLRVRGMSETKQEVSKFLLITVAPLIVFTAFLLFYNAFRAPYLVYLSEYSKSQQQINDLEGANAGLESAGKVAAEDSAKKDRTIADLESKLRGRPPADVGREVQERAHGIQDTLTEFVQRGIDLRNEWSRRMGQTEELQQQVALQIPVWHKSVDEYLKAIPRGRVYSTRFQNQIRGQMGYPVGINLNLAGLWDMLNSDLSRLNEFLVDANLGMP